MSTLRAILFNALMAAWTVLIALAYLPAFILSPIAASRVGRPWARGVLFLARHVCGMRFEITGHENVTRLPVIYASKHQSAFEIVVVMAMFPAPVFILKRELLFIPFFGQYLWRMGMVAIDRKGGAASMKSMLEQCARAVRELRPLVIFPEGTRLPPGTKGRYHPGVAAIYQHLKLPVVPVAVNTGTIWPRNRLDRRKGTATISFLHPIPPGLAPRQFLKQLEERIETASTALLTPSAAPQADIQTD